MLRNNFTKGARVMDSALVASTAGVLSKEEWALRAAEVERQEGDRLKRERDDKERQAEKSAQRDEKKRKREKKTKKQSLSFAGDEEEPAADSAPAEHIDSGPTPQEGEVAEKMSYGMDPTVDTEFLPSSVKRKQERDELKAIEHERNELRERSLADQVTIPLTTAGIDGGKHHKVETTKGSTVYELLSKVYRHDKALASAFSADDVMLLVDDFTFAPTTVLYDILTATAVDGAPIFNFKFTAPKVMLRRWFLGKKNSGSYPLVRTFCPKAVYKKGAVTWEEVA
ncbi:Protein FAM50-like protein [Diplonema papillatum]|nr:Protein FAM50-like protein [Diplonema papillatum]|eukprot:gene18668-28820_t